MERSDAVVPIVKVRRRKALAFMATLLAMMAFMVSCGGSGATGGGNGSNANGGGGSTGGLVAPGCAPDPECHTLAFGGLTRSYLLHVPSNFVPGSSALIIGLHGSQGSGAMFRDNSQLSLEADQQGFALPTQTRSSLREAALPNGMSFSTTPLAPTLLMMSGFCVS